MLNRDITEQDDLIALLDIELESIKKRLEALEIAIGSKQENLTAISDKLEKVRIIVEILELEEKQRSVANIQQSSEYQQLESLRNQIAQFVDDIDKIKDAIGIASQKEAQNKIASAERIIDHYFRKISKHPAITKINLSVTVDQRTNRNSYEFTDQDGRDLTPIFSQGDLNALALAIFLGLACSSTDTQRFGFVMLDDPSQSLGSEHKKQLALVLDEVLEQKRAILSTMDVELKDMLLASLTKTKTTYTFLDWTPDDGPKVQKG